MKFLPGPHQTLFSNWEKLKMFVAHMIGNHRRDWNPAEARDFIDAYLQEIEKVRKPELFPEISPSRTNEGTPTFYCCYNKLPQTWEA